MNRIVIEVDEQVANAFMKAGRQRQKSISNAINGWLKKVVNSSSLKQNKQMLDTISDEAESKGLTADKLHKMLAASKDPLYLTDMHEVNDDFDHLAGETL